MKEYADYHVCQVSNLTQLLRRSVQEYGTRIAFQRMKGMVTYSRWELNVLCVAGSLLHYHGQFIQIGAEDPVLFATGYFAAVISGNIAVLIDGHNSSDTEDRPPISLVLTDTEIRNRLHLPISDYDAMPHRNPEEVCTIVYSSGTTSASKGIMLSQANLCCNVVSGLEKYLFCAGDRLVHLIPYHHAFGLVCDLLAPLLSGATICVPDSKAQALSQMALFQPTLLNAPPAVAGALLSLAKRAGNMDVITGGKLRKILCGGAGLRPSITEELLQWNIKALGCYGVSECSPCVSVNRDDYFKPGSAGVRLNCNEIRIASDGEIMIRGGNVMLGYYNDPVRTGQVIVDGEYHTGDLGYLDEDGFLYVTGRKNNLIVFEDGTKCLPESFEGYILEHSAVQEAIVFAKTINGALRLCVQVYVPQEQLQEDVKRHILGFPSHQPVERIEFSQIPLPKTATGKIRRNQ